ncbi:fibrillarin-like rRNA/tRNA 2'-O-methyltransferase [Candidatus Woesearchaeota archaeon]|nr:fibrillarin-like rRNA/tRNA 2'-O-methyltransferase [Candidatus Woesearchaeota archaeon]
MITQTKFFEIFEEKKKKRSLFTKNLVPGKQVYGEKLVNQAGVEYREWNPMKSKPAAAIMKGLNQFGLKPGDKVLYLGASSGTTVSHFSDIVGREGMIFAVDFAPRVVRDLVSLCEIRSNIAPLLEDANKPETYRDKIIHPVDFLFQDIAQKNQADIFMKNVEMFLKKGGYCLLAVKARSVDITQKPGKIFNDVKKFLRDRVEIVDYRELNPFEKDHAFFVCKKR